MSDVFEELEKEAQNFAKKTTTKSVTISKPNWINILRQHKEEIPIYYDQSGMLWLWDYELNKWSNIDEVEAKLLIHERFPEVDLTDQKTDGRISKAIKLVGRERKVKKPKNTWVQFQNMILDVETGQEIDLDKNYFFTNPIPWDIGINDETPIMDGLIESWVDSKYKDMMYEIIAYCLLCDYPIHRIFCFTGSGRNGKSKYLGLINRFLSDENTSTSDLDLLMSRPFESFKLYRKLVCQMGETNYEGLKRTAILKQLSGQDMISFEKKGKDGFSDYNYAKLLISTNGIPITHDKSEGFYRRWLIIDFPNNFPEGKDILKTIPDYEYENLARKCINILPRLIDDGKFTNEPDINEKKRIYEEKSNPLTLYIKKFMIEDFDGFVGKTEMFSKFSGWLSNNGYRKINYNEFSGLMKLEYDEGQKGNEKTRSWLGLRYLTKEDSRRESNASNASNTPFQSVAYIENRIETSVTSVTSVTNRLLSSIKTVFEFVEEIKSDDLLQKMRNILDFEYSDFEKTIEKMKETGDIYEQPKGILRKL